MGCLFAAQLDRQNIPLTLLLRSTKENQSEITLDIEGVSGASQHQLAVQACSAKGQIDYLLVMTKAYDVLPAVTSVVQRLSPQSVILLLSNGIGFAEQIQRNHPQLQLALGTTTEGAFRRGPWQIQHAGLGSTRIGQAATTATPAWFEDWRSSLSDCHWDRQISAAQWRKLAINCAINPLSALEGCRNGELASKPALAAKVRELCAEMTLIGQAAGQCAAVSGLEHKVFEVIKATAANRSSMLQDITAGRRTEIDYINGYADRCARQFAVEAPLNRELLEALRQLEQARFPQASTD